MIKARFSELSDETIESLRGNLDRLPARLQSAYGYGKEQAVRELDDVRASLRLYERPAMAPKSFRRTLS